MRWLEPGHWLVASLLLFGGLALTGWYFYESTEAPPNAAALRWDLLLGVSVAFGEVTVMSIFATVIVRGREVRQSRRAWAYVLQRARREVDLLSEDFRPCGHYLERLDNCDAADLEKERRWLWLAIRDLRRAGENSEFFGVVALLTPNLSDTQRRWATGFLDIRQEIARRCRRLHDHKEVSRASIDLVNEIDSLIDSLRSHAEAEAEAADRRS